MQTFAVVALSAAVLLTAGCEAPRQIAKKRCGAEPNFAAAMHAATAAGDIDGAAAVKRRIDAYYGCLDREEMRAETENAEAAAAMQSLGNSLQSVAGGMQATTGQLGAAAPSLPPPPRPPIEPLTNSLAPTPSSPSPPIFVPVPVPQGMTGSLQ